MQKLNESDDVYTIEEEVCNDSGDVIIFHKKNGLTHRHERDAFGNTLPAVIFPDGSAEWWIDGKLHRESDLPAMVYLYDDGENNGRTWLFNGLEHRDTKDPVTGLTNPSYISKNGANMRWCMNDVYQRENGLPAMVFENGRSYWFINGKENRENGLPAFEGPKYKAWFKDGHYHRDEDEPAVVFADGKMEWWVNGKYHRDGDKPAVITSKYLEWWVNGKLIRKERR